MRVLHISCHALRGGAAIAAFRLHQQLRRMGLDSAIAAMEGNQSTSKHTIVAPKSKISQLGYRVRKNIDSQLPRLLHPKLVTPFSIGAFGHNLQPILKQFEPDIVNLHWINNGTLSFRGISEIQQPIVWTMHDMWPFTGGCHYSGSCIRYIDSCGRCPQLASKNPHDLSYRIHQSKRTHLSSKKLHVVTPSRWLASCVSQSTLFKHTHTDAIPNGVDIQIFSPDANKNALRKKLNLSKDAKLLFFAAMNPDSDPRKGFKQLLEALKNVRTGDNHKEQIHLVVAGEHSTALKAALPFETHFLGSLCEEEMPSVYAEADVFIAPSLEDNLPNTVIESLACGTPVVAFNIGGMPEMITHKANGYLADNLCSENLAKGIKWILSDHENLDKLSEASRRIACESFSLENQAQAYARLYEEAVNE